MIEFSNKELSNWETYETVRRSGKINMFDMKRGCRLSGLTEDEYKFCIRNYSALRDAVSNKEAAKSKSPE